MATTTYGSPYAQSADLVSAWPATSLTVADRIDDVSFKGNGLNNQTASYTGVLLDAGKTVMMNVATANTFTIPASGAVAYELGTILRVSNKGAGTTTVQPNGGVTLNGGNITLAQYQSATVQLVAADIWSPVATPAPAATPPGMTLISTNTFSGSSAVSINNCFSSAYDNYRVLVDLNGNSSAAEMRIRMRAGGTDSTTSIYSAQQIRASDTTISGVRTAGDYFFAGYCQYATASLDFYNPFATAYTQYQGNNVLSTAIATNALQFWPIGGFYYATTSYDGFTLYPSTSTITGTVCVYGYKKS